MLKPFDELVAEHGPMVLRVCRAVLGPVDAEDAWSDTFLAALRTYPDLDAESNVEAWLVTIAHRKALDQRRSASRRPLPVDEIPEHPAPLQEPDGADEELGKALQDLPLTQRQAVAYHYLAGMPYAEVAAVLGNTEAAARRAAADGIKKLRASCGKEGSP
jgi:RNA polymerase sigma factor (sigma-70 family)